MVKETMNNSTIQYEYPPIGQSTDIQDLITMLMHECVLRHGAMTLAEIGYLNMNSLMYNRKRGSIDLKVYFDPRFCMVPVKNTTGSSDKIRPRDQLRCFEGYLYVGNLNDCISFEKIRVPKTEVIDDELGLKALRIKNMDKSEEKAVAVLHCNLPIAIAAAMNISLSDPQYSIKCSTVAGTKSKNIIMVGDSEDIPVALKVIRGTTCADLAYDPDEIDDYLEMKSSKQVDQREKHEEIAEKIKKKAKDQKKKAEKERPDYKNFAKYS